MPAQRSPERLCVSEEQIERIYNAFEKNPRKFIHEASCQLAIPQTTVWHMLKIAGISRLSSVTILQPDQFVLSKIYTSKLTFCSP